MSASMESLVYLFTFPIPGSESEEQKQTARHLIFQIHCAHKCLLEIDAAKDLPLLNRDLSMLFLPGGNECLTVQLEKPTSLGEPKGKKASFSISTYIIPPHHQNNLQKTHEMIPYVTVYVDTTISLHVFRCSLSVRVCGVKY